MGVERIEEVNQRPIFEDPSLEQWIQNVVCLVCGNADNEDQLLLCDGKSFLLIIQFLYIAVNFFLMI